MYEQVVQFLDYYHWKKNEELSSDFPVYVLKEGRDEHAIILIDTDRYKDFSKEKYFDTFMSVQQQFPSAWDDVRVLTLFVTSEFAKYALLADGTHYWIITPNGKVIVRTEQPEDYCGMRAEMVKTLSTEEDTILNPGKKDPEGKEIVRYRTLKPAKSESFMADCADSFITCYFTIIFLAVNILCYVIPLSMGGKDGINKLWEIYASGWEWTIEESEYWRLFTSMFIHQDELHLLCNLAALAVIGFYLERRVSRTMYLCVYIFGGLIGSVTSLLYYRFASGGAQNVLSAGASGAIFALAGAVAFRLTIAKTMDAYWNADPLPFWDVLVFFAVVGNLISVFFGRNDDAKIDFSAHIGGAIGGFLVMGCFLIFYYLKERKETYNLI